jgi:hypothetical protein
MRSASSVYLWYVEHSTFCSYNFNNGLLATGRKRRSLFFDMTTKVSLVPHMILIHIQGFARPGVLDALIYRPRLSSQKLSQSTAAYIVYALRYFRSQSSCEPDFIPCPDLPTYDQFLCY